MTNLTLIFAALVLGTRWLRLREPLALSGLVLAVVLLIHTRYENPIFLLSIAALAIIGWHRERSIHLTPALLAAPVLLLPCLWVNRVYDLPGIDRWQRASMAGATTPFGWAYLGPNLKGALVHFFDISGQQPNQPLIALLGFGALIAGAVLYWRSPTQPLIEEAPGLACFGLFLPSFGLIAVMMIAFSYGRFDEVITQRLALPFYVVLVAAPLWLLWSPGSRQRHRAVFAAAMAASFVLHTLPASLAAPWNRQGPVIAAALTRDLIHERGSRGYSVISTESKIWICHQVSAMTVAEANSDPDRIFRQLAATPARPIIVSDRIKRAGPDDSEQVLNPPALAPVFLTKTMVEAELLKGNFARLRQVIGPSR